MQRTPLKNRFRDLLIVALALMALLVGSLAMNDRWRHSVTSASQDIHHVTSSPAVTDLSNAATGIVGVVKDFSTDNTFLFSFLVVAAVLVVLMLRT